jgi:lipopolysaccharide transport system ATP-binding protein
MDLMTDEMRSQAIAIEIAHLSKIYSVYASPQDKFLANLLRRPAQSTTHRVIDDITIQIRRGETVGLLGVNGAGKSTLLQLVTGTLTPTAGLVSVSGRVSALLELGAGFNPEWTGRRNAEFYCVIQGVADNLLQSNLARIEAFADIGGFFDQPMRTYSSGMFLRVAFAAAVSIDPDVLIVDEALAVGDARFQNKCFAHFQALQVAGKAILFVTHDVDLMVRFCSRGVLLDKGRVAFDGPPAAAAKAYKALLYGSTEPMANGAPEYPATDALIGKAVSARLPANAEAGTAGHFKWPADPTALRSRPHYNAHGSRVGIAQNCIVDLLFLDETGRPTASDFKSGQRISIVAQIVSDRAVAKPSYGVSIKTVDNVLVYGTTTIMSGQHMPTLAEKEAVVVSFSLSLPLNSGTYFVDIGFSDNEPEVTVLDWTISVASFTIHNSNNGYGFADLGAVISAEGVPAAQLQYRGS